MTEALATPYRGCAQGKAAREAARKAKSKDNTSLNGSGMWGVVLAGRIWQQSETRFWQNRGP